MSNRVPCSVLYWLSTLHIYIFYLQCVSVNLRFPIYHPSLSPLVTISLSKHYFKTLVQCDRDVRFQRDCGCKTTLKLKEYYANVRGHF